MCSTAILFSNRTRRRILFHGQRCDRTDSTDLWLLFALHNRIRHLRVCHSPVLASSWRILAKMLGIDEIPTPWQQRQNQGNLCEYYSSPLSSDRTTKTRWRANIRMNSPILFDLVLNLHRTRKRRAKAYCCQALCPPGSNHNATDSTLEGVSSNIFWRSSASENGSSSPTI